MEQSEQVQHGAKVTPLEVRVAVLEERLNRVNSDIRALDARMQTSVNEIKTMIEKLQNRPNSVQEFLDKNWRGIILCVFAVMGANATVIETLARSLFGG